MVICLAGLVASETTYIGLHAALLLDLNSHYLYLVVGQSNFHLKHVGHHELISLNRVIIVGFLLTTSPWDMNLLLPIRVNNIEVLTSAYTAAVTSTSLPPGRPCHRQLPLELLGCHHPFH